MELKRENLCYYATVAGEEKHDEVVYIQIRREIIRQQRVPKLMKLMKLNANAKRCTQAHLFLFVGLLFSQSEWLA